MSEPRIKAVLFDLDGTLTNTLPDIAGAMNRSLRHFGLPEWNVDDYRHLVGNGAVKLAERAVRERQELMPAVLDLYMRDYRDHSAVETAPYPGIPELLLQLRDRGISLCVYSNKPDPDTQFIVRYYFPDTVFTVIQGSRPGLPLKPDPAVPLSIAAELGLSPAEFAYLGDSGVDMRCAAAAGMRPFGVLWGFRDAAELTADGAEALLTGPSDLLDYLD